MIKDELKKSEPIIYQALSRTFKNNKVAHSYLLEGPANSLKKKTAILIAQSIIEDENDLACEACVRCQRIAEDKYFDVIFVDGGLKPIVKEDISNIFEEFHTTSLENSPKKVFIINLIENANTKVWNMILKSIEEPNDNSYWIFISDNTSLIPNTIVSRCARLSFHHHDEEDIEAYYHDLGFDDIDAYLLTDINKEKLEIDLNDKAYLLAKEFTEKTIDSLDEPYKIEFIFIDEWYGTSKKSDNEIIKRSQDYYLSIMIRILLDKAINKDVDDLWYRQLMEKIAKEDVEKLLEVFYEIKDLSMSKLERKLLFDRLAYKLVHIEGSKM